MKAKTRKILRAYARGYAPAKKNNPRQATSPNSVYRRMKKAYKKMSHVDKGRLNSTILEYDGVETK